MDTATPNMCETSLPGANWCFLSFIKYGGAFFLDVPLQTLSLSLFEHPGIPNCGLSAASSRLSTPTAGNVSCAWVAIHVPGTWGRTAAKIEPHVTHMSHQRELAKIRQTDLELRLSEGFHWPMMTFAGSVCNLWIDEYRSVQHSPRPRSQLQPDAPKIPDSISPRSPDHGLWASSLPLEW